LEGALALFVPRHHKEMLARASSDQLIEQIRSFEALSRGLKQPLKELWPQVRNWD
jgi:hypothetical protein